MTKTILFVLCVGVAACAGTQNPGEAEQQGYAPIPPGIATPDTVDSSIGTLRYFDGLPDAATVTKVYDHLDFSRAVRAYLQSIPGVSMIAMREGLYAAGLLPNYTVFVSESLVDARSRFLTLDTETVYATAWVSLKGGPIVVETPPRTVGVFVDTWQRHLADTGYPGPDRGKGGTYVIVPPGYAGYVPDSQYAVRSRTMGVWVLLQGFLVEGSTRPAVENFRSRLKIYPIKESERPPPNQFVDMSGLAIDTIPPNDASFFERLHQLLEEEPRESQDPELLGLLSAMGIEKDRGFAPDDETQAILSEAATVGDITVRALLFGERNPAPPLREDSHWRLDAMAESDEFLVGGARALDARATYRYYATAHTPKKADALLGRRYESAVVFRDTEGRPLDGARRYTLTLPAEVPAKNFWSLVVYDNETRSMLQTNQPFAGINTAQTAEMDRPPPVANDDGSTTLYFGPTPPPKERGERRSRAKSRRNNWIQTTPGRGWNAILRLYGALAPWNDRSWVPGEITPLSSTGGGPADPRKVPRMATPDPSHFVERGRVSTRLGMLEQEYGVPTADTVERVYANLDRARGIDAFLTTVHGASIVSIRQGLASVGIESGETIGIFDRYLDAHSLVLTGSGDTVEVLTWLDLAKGAMIVDNPRETPGVLDDFTFANVTDLGPSGPDAGKGGLFLFTPPNYQGQVSERYLAYGSPTYGNLLTWHSLPESDDPTPTVQRLEDTLEVYAFDFDFDEDFDFDAPPPEEPEEPEEATAANTFVPLSGRPFNTIHPNDVRYYDTINEWVQRQPAGVLSPEMLGLLASVGIVFGRRFEPGSATRATLADAAAIAHASARALAFRPRDTTAYRGGDGGWYTAFTGNSSKFLRNGARRFDARTMYFYLSTGVSPTLASDQIGTGTKTALRVTDREGAYLRGDATYEWTLPADVPGAQGWSVVVYDPQTRSMLQAPGHPRPTLASRGGSVQRNPDGSTTLRFGPRAPEGAEGNWIRTVPSKGWFVALRVHGPLKAWFDQTWQPGEIVRAP